MDGWCVYKPRSLPCRQPPSLNTSNQIITLLHGQVFVDGIYRPELSQLQHMPSPSDNSPGWRAGSVHAFADTPAVQQELLAEVAWAPEVGMRHTLAAGSLPFTSLNQVRCLLRCVVGFRH